MGDANGQQGGETIGARIKDQNIIAALKKTRGTVYLAARELGISSQTIYNHIAKNPLINETITQQRGELIDTAEIALANAVLNGEAWAVSMTLKTIGKDRGYVERTENKSEVELSGSISDISDEELEKNVRDIIARRTNTPQ